MNDRQVHREVSKMLSSHDEWLKMSKEEQEKKFHQAMKIAAAIKPGEARVSSKSKEDSFVTEPLSLPASVQNT